MKRLWQRTMIALARSPRVKAFMQRDPRMTTLSRRFMAGPDLSSAVATAHRLLEEKGIRTSFYYLGEYVDRQELVDENVAEKLGIAARLRNEALDVHISVDPTQIGLHINPDQVSAHARTIGRAVADAASRKAGLHCLMLDMEDSSVVDFTIALHGELRGSGLPVAITLQAYLRRTEADLTKLIAHGAKVRLVKGAFIGRKDVAYTTEAEIKGNYRKLVELMLSPVAQASGFYPIIATHDERVLADAIATAQRHGWTKGSYEFEMLLGVRNDVAENLAAQGERVRLYVPFGRDWWPYAVRRIGEKPANGLLLARALLSEKKGPLAIP